MIEPSNKTGAFLVLALSIFFRSRSSISFDMKPSNKHGKGLERAQGLVSTVLSLLRCCTASGTLARAASCHSQRTEDSPCQTGSLTFHRKGCKATFRRGCSCSCSCSAQLSKQLSKELSSNLLKRVRQFSCKGV